MGFPSFYPHGLSIRHKVTFYLERSNNKPQRESETYKTEGSDSFEKQRNTTKIKGNHVYTDP